MHIEMGKTILLAYGRCRFESKCFMQVVHVYSFGE